jgi:hypothetical protein
VFRDQQWQILKRQTFWFRVNGFYVDVFSPFFFFLEKGVKENPQGSVLQRLNHIEPDKMMYEATACHYDIHKLGKLRHIIRSDSASPPV